MYRKSLDLALAVGLAIAASLSIVLGLSPILRLVLSVLLVLVLPGFALTAALFPHRSLAAPERVLFTFGLSLTVSVLGGLVLNFTPWGIEPKSWAVFLACITVASGAVGVTRRTAQVADAEDRDSWHQGMTAREYMGSPPGRIPSGAATPRMGILLGLA